MNLGSENDQTSRRVLTSPWMEICRAAGIAMSLLHLYAFGYKVIVSGILYAYHLLFGLFLIFLFFKPSAGSKRERVDLMDVALALASVATCIYPMIGYEDYVLRVQTLPTNMDIVFGAVLVVLVLEAARRTTGLGLPTIALVCILYALLGGHIPGPLGHRGYDIFRVVGYAYSEQGIFGTSLGVSATYVYLFILFASFLQTSGADRFFKDISFALAGGLRGGPAKIAVVSSAFFGTISGSAVANVVGTGTFTIPLMKSLGYSPVFAGAVEAVASTGGQIMPPIMGAAAFIVADIVGVPYIRVCLAAAIPAILLLLRPVPDGRHAGGEAEYPGTQEERTADRQGGVGARLVSVAACRSLAVHAHCIEGDADESGDRGHYRDDCREHAEQRDMHDAEEDLPGPRSRGIFLSGGYIRVRRGRHCRGDPLAHGSWAQVVGPHHRCFRWTDMADAGAGGNSVPGTGHGSSHDRSLYHLGVGNRARHNQAGSSAAGRSPVHVLLFLYVSHYSPRGCCRLRRRRHRKGRSFGGGLGGRETGVGSVHRPIRVRIRSRITDAGEPGGGDMGHDKRHDRRDRPCRLD